MTYLSSQPINRDNMVTLTLRLRDNQPMVLEYADLDTAVRVLKACTDLPDNQITGWSLDDLTDPCVHPGLMAYWPGGHVKVSSPEYQQWLDAEQMCSSCNRPVRNRDL